MAKRLGARQTEILRILWRQGQATAREISEEMNRSRPTAHSTVQTLLREMETKGVVAHRQDERTFVFYPTVAEGEVTVTATRDLIRRLFEDSPLRLMTHLLAHENLSQEDIDRLHRIIEERRRDTTREREKES